LSTTSIAIREPGLRRRARVVLGIALTCGALAVAATTAGVAQAARAVTATVCVQQATLYETPGGAMVGILHRGDRIRVVGKGPHGTWWRVVASFGTRGWLRGTSVCGRHR